MEEIKFGPQNLGWSAARVREAAQRGLETVGLADLASAHPYDLNPGQRKLVTIASILAMDTPILIFDEPTTGQDYRGVELVGRIVEESHP